MKFASCLAVLSTAASLAAAFVNPTEPWGESKWVPGTNVTITWIDDGTEPKLSTNPIVDIFLNSGGDQTNVKIGTVATGINAGTTSSFVYTVPYVDPPGKIYFLTIVPSKAGGPGQAWSTRFTITDAQGNPGTLAPSAPVGSNSGAIGSIIATPTGGSGATPTVGGTTSGAATPTNGTSVANPTATAAGGKNGGSTLSASLSVVAAAAVGAAALFAF
ncbi:hypothetical protein BGZ76_005670 [Entomortierella beljakovae]|nr:hypothetical protein BGZ76_005670 [Entomortierella beljakovae]